MNIRNVSIFCFLTFLSICAQGIKFEHYSDEQGLSQNSVRHIVQDNSGLLWLGTFSGLTSFDGNSFTVYHSKLKSPKSINNDDITALVINHQSNEMWIGTRNGLTRQDLKTCRFETFLPEKNNPNSLPDAEIRALYIDKFNRLWIGTKDNGLCFYSTESNVFTKVEINGFNYIKSIYEDSNGHIWIGSYETGGVAQITLNNEGDIDQIKKYTLSSPGSKELNPYVYFIYQDDKADIFAGTREGLYKLNKIQDTFAQLPLPNTSTRNLLGPYFICVAQAPDGKYWIGTLGGLIVCDHLENISTGKYNWYYSALSDKSSLVDNSISALFFDHSGTLWIGTENGLDKYDTYQNQFKSIKNISALINGKIPRISGIAQTCDDKLIVSTHNNGLFIGQNNKFSVLPCPYKKIASIYTSNGKTFYCGLWNGNILQYNYINKRAKLLNVGFNENPTVAFTTLENGKLFIGSHGDGAVIFDTQSRSFEELNPYFFHGIEINQVVSDGKETLWMAAERGVVKFNRKNNKAQIYAPEKLNIDYAKDIAIDAKGTVWVATKKGLCYFDSTADKLIPVALPGELRNEWITDIRFEQKGNLWLNFNNNKVGKYNPSTKQFTIYQINSGNRLDIFSNRGFLLFNDSLVYLAGKDGIIYFPTNGIKNNIVSDPPFITEVKVQNQKILPGETINGKVILNEVINYSKKMVLDYVNRNFSLSFSSPSYVNVRLNKFQYMLEGFDKEWITADNNSRNIQYTNLPPDEYIFKVRTKNSNGHWSKISAYKIIIRPPFWMTWKCILLFVVVVSLITYLVHKQIRKSMRLKHELILEKVKREKDEKLNNEKLRFFTNISHEFRTPISLILGPAKQLLEDENISNYQKNRINLILNNSGRLLTMVNQLLDFRKAQTGKLRLKVSETDILLLTQNIFKSFKSLASEKKIKLNLTAENTRFSGWLDQDKYDKILYNLLSNAIKYTRRYGNIDLFIALKNDGKKLVVEVSDDGIGIPPESQKKIFSRFYQVEKDKAENTGSGIGLSLVKSLVKIHKAKIQVHSEPGKGSIFRVEIPIDKNSYKNTEIFDVTGVTVNSESHATNKARKKIQTTSLKEKILVIDDNLELRNFIAEYLSDSYKVYEAENGARGLQVCRQVKPMLCIADIKMPEKDGFEFCSDLKKDFSISHIPVILLTALSENENIIKGYKLGADGYMTKPFDPALLKTRIENIIKTRLALKAKFSEEVESTINILSHSPADENFMKELNRLVESQLNKPNLKIDFLCKEMGTSSSKLYRKIKELTDLSPNEFIRTLRLKKSAQILKTKKYNVSEVSDMVGFNDPLYFSRCFKKQFGISPSNLL